MLVLQQEPSGWLRWTASLALCLLLPLASHAADPKRNLTVSKTTPAVTEQRVALVIGNANYKTAPLRNPANDARAVADKLQGLGFKVTLKLDQDQKGMADAIRTFGNQLRAGGAGLFYYAGHGMQVKGRNFLIPVDADIQNEDEVPYRGIDANEVLSKMETARNRLNLMILDACRNNPFSRKFRSASQGLAQMDAPSGTLVAFATAPGSVASDGSGKNGIYTQHLLASLGQPGVPVEQVFKRVRVGVMKDTRNAQVPWESSSLVGDFYFKPGTAAPVTADPTAIELAFWESIKDSASADDYKAYLRKYPNGQFVDLAKRRTMSLQKPATAVTSAEATQNLEKGIHFYNQGKYPDAIRWFRKAADQGNANAQGRLGAMYSLGRGVAKDEAEAVRWFRKAAEQGLAPAQNDLGVMYSNGRGVAKDDAEAVRWYRKAAEQGHASAQFNLGHMYAKGQGVAKDEGEAVRWYRKAAEQGFAKGQNNLGVIYEKGQGVAKDEAEAVRWFRKAAEQGDADAQTNLGAAYANGRGVAKDDTEAVRWFRKAVEQGNANAQRRLGAMYFLGRGVAKDDAEAVRWFRKAAEQGDAGAQTNLGVAYANGRGVAKDEAEAVRWYRKAAEQGYAGARTALKKLGFEK